MHPILLDIHKWICIFRISSPVSKVSAVKSHQLTICSIYMSKSRNLESQVVPNRCLNGGHRPPCGGVLGCCKNHALTGKYLETYIKPSQVKTLLTVRWGQWGRGEMFRLGHPCQITLILELCHFYWSQTSNIGKFVSGLVKTGRRAEVGLALFMNKVFLKKFLKPTLYIY